MTNRQTLPAPLRGIVPPMITPLRASDELDQEGLERLVARVLEGGASGLFVLGTTGEGPALSYRLRYELVARTCEIVAGRAPVLVGVTDASLVESIELARHAAAEGAAAIVAAPPYYFPTGQAGLRRWFEQLADASPLPLFLYNMPSCVKVWIDTETVEALRRHPNIAGIKDSSGDLEYFARLLKVRAERPGWSVLVGPEHLLGRTVMQGGDGGVCGGANLHPRLFVEMFEAASGGDSARVDALQRGVLALGRIYELGKGDLPVTRGLKAALSLLGVCSGTVAEPFLPLDDAALGGVMAHLAENGLIAQMAAT